ncbi:hypothetical protein HW555_001058 [Spodoptera exigua]|uniref:Uncharacterized protein n=1 Tax=Spodoptera exigua TaxID=7107 RepID=A0A835GS26_SPOEX|nr:hypothetical protein HW555_001058 [Spodoptera exigua]
MAASLRSAPIGQQQSLGHYASDTTRTRHETIINEEGKSYVSKKMDKENMIKAIEDVISKKMGFNEVSCTY